MVYLIVLILFVLSFKRTRRIEKQKITRGRIIENDLDIF